MGYKNAINVYDQKMGKPEKQLNNSLITDYKSERAPYFTQVPGCAPRISPLKAALWGRQANNVNASVDNIKLNQNHSQVRISMPSSPSGRQSGSPFAVRNTSAPLDFDTEKKYTANRFQFNYDASRHNPITNPIGDYIPKPAPGTGLFRGKGSLQKAGAHMIIR
jgi:hypothetical protein